MSNIGTTISLGRMGVKADSGQIYEAEQSIKRKNAKLSFKPNAAQEKAMLVKEIKRIVKRDEDYDEFSDYGTGYLQNRIKALEKTGEYEDKLLIKKLEKTIEKRLEKASKK
jgi:hypothetical protein